MYDKDGAFGRSQVVTAPYRDNSGFELFGLACAGWHLCNDLYRVERAEGCGQFLIFITTGGRGCLKSGSESVELPAGSVTVVPPALPIRYFTPPGGEWEFYWMHPFEGGLSHRLLERLIEDRLLSFKVQKAEQAGLYLRAENIIKSLGALPAGSLDFSEALCAFFHQIAKLRRAALEPEDASPSLTEQIIKYLHENSSQPVSLEKMSGELFASPGHIIRTLKKETGMTPHAYLLELRLKKAEALLRYSGESAEEIARKTGFSSPSHFAYRFRLTNGMSPMEYRRGGGIK